MHTNLVTDWDAKEQMEGKLRNFPLGIRPKRNNLIEFSTMAGSC